MVGLVAVVAAGTVVPQTAAARAEVPDSAPDQATAVRYAEQGDKPVVVESATTETDELKANPDGTMTFTQHLQPVRVRRGDGWVPVDLSLERKPDGTFGPKASTVDVAFSDGSGPEPLAAVAQGGREVGLDWQGDLPEPVVDGPTLTYRNVLPDVDLKVEATYEGFTELLVIKTPEAADHPALDRVEFRTHAEDVALEQGPRPDGDLVVKDDAGKPVFVGDASRMWDSSGGEAAEGVDVAGLGDRQAAMDVEVTADTVAITPDRAFLDAPTTTYPVVLDPEYNCTNCGKVHHVVVQQPWPNDRNFDATGGNLGDLKAGWLTAADLGAPSSGSSRTYLQMNTEPIIGKYIHSASLHVNVIHSYSCSPTSTELYLANWIDANTTWNNQSGWSGNRLGAINKANNARYCPGDGGADFDVLSAVRSAANGSWGWTTFVLKAENEGSTSGWRRFDLNPYLVVKYNSYPNQPRDMSIGGTDPSTYLPCRVGADRSVVGTFRPRLRARLSDNDPGRLDAGFRLMHGPADAYSWNGQDIYAGDIANGEFAEVDVPEGWITRDGVYTWHLWSGDYQLSSWSPNCEFEVDATKPNTPEVTSEEYPATGVHGSVGRTGAFTFSPNGNTGPGGSMDVRKYGWSFNNDTSITDSVDVTSADGSVTVPITPPRAGLNTLYVTAFDRAGNRSVKSAEYLFEVAEPVGPTGSWALDETTGAVAADETTANRPLTLNGGASFTPGYSGNGLSFNGTTGFAATATPVLDTTRAFTVSAWAKLNGTGGYHTVVGQDGDWGSPFFLQYSADVGRWTFTTGVDGQNFSRLASTTPPRVGVWTHLLGTYDPAAHQLKLYVDGKLEGTGTATIRPAGGSLTVGASWWDNKRTDFFPGSVDRVRTWDRLLTPDEVAAEANTAVLRAHYALDERTGTTTRDAVSGQQATLAGGANWAGSTDPDAYGEEKWLNYKSTPGSVTGPRPAELRTDRSYSVSAWVRLGDLQYARSAVSLGDSQYAPFMLMYRPENKQWGFLMTQNPVSSAWWVALSNSSLTDRDLNKWVHLVGTYDAVTGRIALYVNGAKQTKNFSVTPDGSGVTGWNGTGSLSLGRGFWGGQPADPWLGDVDDARVYSGVLTPGQVSQVYFDTFHF
ncbi:LamG-like jellyroll fold domain-containing protein [Saccharothrix syringae]|uniref:LamG domain-containing protein n=1 Tax=Saccharothrix syringae TaxID=103733 RepID=A0A5Q0GYL4_SACSY|nr:LamG-like jellyroll fold domain-containing protein [Saccharothrix syringae]QFZ19049.1 LamG domain-containing protein [Saccharothrix syringae]